MDEAQRNQAQWQEEQDAREAEERQQEELEATWERNERIHDAIVALCHTARTVTTTNLRGVRVQVDIVGENNVLINDTWYAVSMEAELLDDSNLTTEWRWLRIVYAPTTGGFGNVTMPMSDVETIKVFR